MNRVVVQRHLGQPRDQDPNLLRLYQNPEATRGEAKMQVETRRGRQFNPLKSRVRREDVKEVVEIRVPRVSASKRCLVLTVKVSHFMSCADASVMSFQILQWNGAMSFLNYVSRLPTSTVQRW